MEKMTDTERRKAIGEAYELLSDGDKVLIDLQVKRIMDYIEALNFDRRINGKAIFQMSRSGALEIIYSLGRMLQGKINV